MENVVIRGLPLLALLVLVGGCGDRPTESAAPSPDLETQRSSLMDTPDAPPMDEEEDPPMSAADSEKNPCNWPDFCGPPSARAMLQEIVERAEADEVKQAIAPEVLERIRHQVPRILDPQLTGASGRHVCDLTDPKACDELKRIFDEIGSMPLEPKVRRDRWETVATDLESFPTGK